VCVCLSVCVSVSVSVFVSVSVSVCVSLTNVVNRRANGSCRTRSMPAFSAWRAARVHFVA
jgi:hypothetical protein